MGQPNYEHGFKVALHPQSLELPLKWKKPQTIFVNSMSDLFHKDVPVEFILRVFEMMNKAYWHRYQILTKRSERLKELDRDEAHLFPARHIVATRNAGAKVEQWAERLQVEEQSRD